VQFQSELDLEPVGVAEPEPVEAAIDSW
jgi:hypothetical protein